MRARLSSPSLLAASLLALSACAAPSNPLSPDEERASFRFADDRLTIELVAAEPQVVSPVSIAFDAAGRLFVAEMLDYPSAQTSGRIRLLQDTDADGRYETATVYADQLPFPNGVLPWRNGVLVTAAPDVWFLSDTNADGRADERRVLVTGFAPGNQQLRVNGLTWGLDNWVYGANGRSDGDIRRPSDSPGKAISIRGRDFRFRPDTGEFEPIAGRSQFGLAIDDWGNRFLSWNTIPVRHEVLPQRYLDRNPHFAATESLAEIIEAGDTGRVFPMAPPPLTFNNESVKNFNALSGLTIFRGGALGEEYRGNAFVGESLLNLVHRRVLEPSGATFIARRHGREREREFLASTDPWFHPVNFATGPDGALYIVDFYRKFVEHPDWVRGPARAEVQWRTGAEHGRIWRVRNSKTPVFTKPGIAVPALLLEELHSDNGWRRDRAQRLLVERQERSVIPALRQLLRGASFPLPRLHALYTLAGLNALTPDLLLTVLKSSHAPLREHALRLTEPFLDDTHSSPHERAQVLDAIVSLVDDPDARVRFQLALTLGAARGKAAHTALANLAARDFSDRWVRLALLSSIGSNGLPFLTTLLQQQPQWLVAPHDGQSEFLRQTARLIGAAHHQTEIKEVLHLLVRTPQPGSGHLALLAGFAEGLDGPRSLRNLMSRPPEALKHELAALSNIVSAAAVRAVASHATTAERLHAIRILARVTPGLSAPHLLRLLQPGETPEIQSAAAQAVAQLDDAAVAETVFTNWSQYPAAARRRLLAAAPRSANTMLALANALDARILSPVELDPSVREALLKNSADSLKLRFNTLFANTISPDRQQVIARFQPALKLNGDPARGAALFANTCLQCHPLQGRGQPVGPDLSAVASRPKDALLIDILDPSRQVPSDFINYTLTTSDGRILSGFIVAETASSITLRRANAPDETVLRTQAKELRAEGKSLMPDGLEQTLTAQDMSDLLAFLQKPDPHLLPAP